AVSRLPSCFSQVRCDPFEAFVPSFGHSHLEHRVANRRRFEAGPDRQHGLITALFEGHRRDHFTGWIALVLRTVRLHHIVPVGRVFRTVERHDESLGYHNLTVDALDRVVDTVGTAHHDPMRTAD